MMSKIDELIKEKCPNGVEYKSLNKVADLVQGFAFENKKFAATGKGIVRTTNIQNGIISEESMVYFNPDDYGWDFDRYAVTKNRIIIGMSGTIKVARNLSDKVYYLNQRVGMFIPKQNINNDYLYHVLSNSIGKLFNMTSGSAVKNLSSKDINSFRIPVPPIEVQEEIVRILDKFGELEAEIEAELEARKSQYEFWRDRIFNEDADLKSISEILVNKGYIRGPFGSALVKSDMVDDGIPVYEQQHAIYGHRDFRYYITEEKAKKLNRFSVERDDLIISCSGTVGKVSIITDNDPKGIINQALLILRLNKDLVLPKYMKYYLESPVGYKNITANTNKSAQVNIANRDAIEKILIPIPNLDKQREIIFKLDKFDKLVNDIYVGLPAEIEARRKQYEYYRNELLSFEELTNE